MLCVLASVRTFSQQAIHTIDNFLVAEFSSNDDGAVVLIAKGDSIIYKKSFGPVSEDMIFQIASMTKQFTGAAIRQLELQKKISLNDPIQKYIEFPDKVHVITIDHLLSQTSGIPEFFDVDESEKHLLTKPHTPQQIIDYFRDRPLDFTPGERFAYSNSNYVLLGAIIEAVSGMPYSQYMEQFVFTPLQLTNTSVWYRHSSPGKNIAVGHPNVFIDSSVMYSSGGIVSTADDLFKWTNSWVANNPMLFEKIGYQYGLDVRELQGSKTIQHGGNLFGFTSSGIYLPTERLYVCILANSGFRGTEGIADYVASEMIGKPLTVPRKLADNTLDAYGGTYKLQNTQRLMEVSIVANTLVLVFPDQPGSAVDLQPTTTDNFESKKVKAKLSFKRDPNGVVYRVDVKQGKGSYTWIKEAK